MAAVIHAEPRTVDHRLRQLFNSTADQWIAIVKAAVAARAGCTENDARSAGGFYAWNAATAEARRIFLREGWVKGDEDGIETIENADLNVMVAVMNTDGGTCDQRRSPRNRTLKGAASEKIVDLNGQEEMFVREEMAGRPVPQASSWYLCIYDDGTNVRAELSRPEEFRGGYIVKYSERIFILREGDWEKVVLDNDADGDEGGYEVNVRRK